MVESLRTCASSRVCSPSSPSAFSSHAVSSLAPSLPPSPLKRRIDLTSHFCFSFQHFMSLCPLSKVKGLFFYLPFTSCAWFWFIPPPRGTQRWGGRRARARSGRLPGAPRWPWGHPRAELLRLLLPLLTKVPSSPSPQQSNPAM